jgi:nucleotide-binding universal stress UspA family protein
MTILVAAANDAVRDRVIDVAVDLGAVLGEELYVVHLLPADVSTADANRMRASLERRLADEPVVSTISLDRIDYSVGRPHRQVGRELAGIVAAHDVSHVVVGHAPKEPVETVTKGNAAFAVTDEVSVPVTVVPPIRAADADPE